MVNHRGPEFVQVLKECSEALQAIFQTQSGVLAFPASGTGGLEAAIVNTLSPGDRVLSCSVGAFGDRLAKIAGAFGASVESCGFEWGQAVDPATVASRLKDAGPFKAVLMTHNETSTGVVNDVRALAQLAHEHGALLIVDSISGLIVHDLQFDEWGPDIVVAGSQKAFMIPPGLTFIAVSARGWAASEQARMPRYYFDFKQMRDKDLTPYTPPVSLFFALQEASRLLLEEGLPAVRQRHAVLAGAVRAGLDALGLELLAPEGSRSNSVTAIRVPQPLTVKAIRSHIRDRYGVTVAGGQGKLEAQIFRIGHLGYIGWPDVVATLAALEMTLADLGMPVNQGTAAAAAQQVLRTSGAL
jgi:aspartate aminotransferase-like enzyme